MCAYTAKYSRFRPDPRMKEIGFEDDNQSENAADFSNGAASHARESLKNTSWGDLEDDNSFSNGQKAKFTSPSDVLAQAIQKVDLTRSTLGYTLEEVAEILAVAEKTLKELEKEKKELAREKALVKEQKAMYDVNASFVAQHNSIQSNAIEIVVNGRTFTTSRDVLCVYPDSMLAAMFSGRYALKTDAQGRVVLDRDADRFKFIMDFCRNSMLGKPTRFPDEESKRASLRNDFDFFCLPWPDDSKWLVQGLINRVPGVPNPHVVPDLTGALALDMNETHLLIGCVDKNVYVYDALNLTKVHTLSGHTVQVSCVALCRNIAASAARDRTIRLWDVVGGQSIAVLQHSDSVWCLGLSSGLLVCGTRDKPQLTMWEVSWSEIDGDKATVTPLPPIENVAVPFGRIQVHDKAVAIQSAHDHSMRVQHVDGRSLVFKGHRKRIDQLFLSQHTLVGASRMIEGYVEVNVWDRHSGAILQHRILEMPCNCQALSEHVLFFQEPSRRRLWLVDIFTGRSTSVAWEGHFMPGPAAVVYNSQSLAAIARDKSVLVWKTGAAQKVLRHGKTTSLLFQAGHSSA